MAKVTYLLGAGASYNALPVVDEIPDVIARITKQLTRKRRGVAHDLPILYESNEYQKALELAIDHLTQLEKGCNDHLSIDTFLKMLFLTKNGKYEHMKGSISLMFELCSILKKEINENYNSHTTQYRPLNNIDKRYDAFLSSILKDSYDILPESIKVLSWNYDNQMEISYQRYLDNAKQQIENVSSLLNICHKYQDVSEYDSTKFSFFKINGSISWKTSKCKFVSLHEMKKSDTDKLFNVLLNYYSCQNSKQHTSSISFGWDSPQQTKELLNCIFESTNDTEVLVVIGYSFPFFNRDVDNQILLNMGMLQKVYVQDPNPDGAIERLSSTLNHIPTENFVPIKNTKQFYLPPEL